VAGVNELGLSRRSEGVTCVHHSKPLTKFRGWTNYRTERTTLMRFGARLAPKRLEMKALGDLRMVLLGLAVTTALFGQLDAREIIRKSVVADERSWRIARNCRFVQRVELRRLDSQGRLTSSEVKTYDITLQEGTPYRQLVQRDDHPLPATEERTEQESLAKSIANRRQETAVERGKRLLAYEGRPDWQREAWHELPDAFDFRLVREGILDGHSTVIIEAMPRQGYLPRSRTAKLFRSLKGIFWVDQQDHQIVKVEVQVIDTVSVGLFLVRVAKGSHATLELTRVGDGVWLADRLKVFASARLGLLKTFRFEQLVDYSRYSCVPAVARAIDPGEGRDSHIGRLNPSAKATSPIRYTLGRRTDS
jgi:hypothetical protein